MSMAASGRASHTWTVHAGVGLIKSISESWYVCCVNAQKPHHKLHLNHSPRCRVKTRFLRAGTGHGAQRAAALCLAPYFTGPAVRCLSRKRRSRVQTTTETAAQKTDDDFRVLHEDSHQKSSMAERMDSKTFWYLLITFGVSLSRHMAARHQLRVAMADALAAVRPAATASLPCWKACW